MWNNLKLICTCNKVFLAVPKQFTPLYYVTECLPWYESRLENEGVFLKPKKPTTP